MAWPALEARSAVNGGDVCSTFPLQPQPDRRRRQREKKSHNFIIQYVSRRPVSLPSIYHHLIMKMQRGVSQGLQPNYYKTDRHSDQLCFPLRPESLIDPGPEVRKNRLTKW